MALLYTVKTMLKEMIFLTIFCIVTTVAVIQWTFRIISGLPFGPICE
jgi:hypothetical protein